jgi:homotetrameric cytidine deaminase
MIENRKLLNLAKEAAAKAYAPYSKFKVGAALLADSGQVYTAGNMENASYSLSLCAERAALAKAVAEGEREFLKIAVYSDKQHPVVPCGACLQSLAEFDTELEIISEGAEGDILVKKLTKYLPQAFRLKRDK